MVKIEARGLGKRYGHDFVFRGLDLSIAGGDSVSVTGPNGSGKSTLLRILGGLLRATEGSVEMSVGERIVDDEGRPLAIGYVAPVLNFYRSMTAIENLHFLLRLRRLAVAGNGAQSALESVGLGRRGNDPVGSYSSGMLQRLRIAAATLHSPKILLLDEPFSNLDEKGNDIVRRFMASHVASGGLLMLATNNGDEAALCESDLCVADFTG